MSAELDPALHERITVLSEAGDTLAEDENYAGAIARYREALALVPVPVTDWEAATWIYAAIGDAAFLAGAFAEARAALEAAMHCPDAIGNPFIHLRLGQALYELDEHDRAADELIRAYMGAGAEIFENEDPQYLEFLATRARLD